MLSEDTYRAVIVLPYSHQVLVIAGGGPPELPKITIPGHSRVAEQLTRAIEERWHLQSIVVDYLTDGTVPGAIFELRTPDETLAVKDLVSIDIDEIPELDLTLNDRIKLRMILSNATGERGPFARLGWMDEVMAWTQSSVSARNWRLTGRFRQLNASPSFSLIRFETTGPALWFKAVGEPNLRECSISIALANLFSEYVPTLVATQSEWNAWLTVEADGSHPDESSEIELCERVVTALGRLQMASTEKTAELLEARCRDLRMPALVEFVDPFLDLVDALMRKQAKVPPPRLTRQELHELGNELKTACMRLEELGLPDTLGHLDFNPGNILVSSRSCLFLDWAEACISHPFLTLEYLLEHLRRSHPADSGITSRLIAAYSRTWSSVVSPDRILEAFELTPLIAAFAYAVGNDAWRDSHRLEDGKLAGYFRGLARRMHREAALIPQRRMQCLA